MNPFQRMLMQFVAFQTVQIETVPLINELCRLKSRLQFAENSFDIVQKLPRQFNKLHQLNYWYKQKKKLHQMIELDDVINEIKNSQSM